MPYLLDGNNLIGTARGKPRPSEEDVQALVGEIAERLRRNRARATLFFDGPAGGRPLSLGSLSIRYPKQGSADRAILEEIARSRTPTEMVVVTADRELGRQARDAGGKWVVPEEFWSGFGRGTSSPRRQTDGKPSEPRVDVDDWMRYFGLWDEERKPPE